MVSEARQKKEEQIQNTQTLNLEEQFAKEKVDSFKNMNSLVS